MNRMVETLAWIGNRIGKPPGWERVVRLFASPERCRAMRDVCVIREGIAFLAQPSVPLGWHVAFFGTYEPEMRDIFRAVLPVGGLALDVGANVGWHTLLMARLVGETGRVLAAEANPSVRARLEANLRLNRLAHAEVVPYAMAQGRGTVEFYGPEAGDPDSGNGHVAAMALATDGRTFQVETRSVDSILEESRAGRLDLLKIDVEGFEWPVLQGAEQSIGKYRPHILFEYNAEYAARGGGSAQVMEAFLLRHGYTLFAIGRNWAEALKGGRWPECTDIWAVPSG